MNNSRFEEAALKIADSMKERFGTHREHAEHFAKQSLDNMVEREEAYKLSDDEERLLRAYRAFVVRSSPDSIFSWKSPKGRKGIVTPPEVSIIRDPQEVS